MPARRRSRSVIIAVVLGLLAGQVPQAASAAPPTITIQQVVSGLVFPWDIGFLPDGTMLVTERPGRVQQYASGIPGAALIRTITIPDVRAEGESGLMGIAVDIDFASNGFVYVCASRDLAGASPWENEVIRYTVAANGSWGSPVVLLSNMAANTIHNGCALEMDRFGMLWITMGDANNSSLAQNRNSLNGKVLRITRTGATPGDNPLIAGTRNAVFSMGHRNPQGIAFRPGTDQVYAVEHGPDRDDEVNLIQPGGNYGWPCYTGAGLAFQTAGCGPPGNYLSPVYATGSPTIATSGAAFSNGAQWADFDGHLWISQLKQMDVRRFSINVAGTSLGNPELYHDGIERLRAMVSGPGGQLYVTTSDGGDRVLRIKPMTPVVNRIAGADRYATAAAVSQSGYPGGATAVMIATGLDFPDALAGSAAAGMLGMPVLLVQPNAIPAATRAEVDRLNPQQIYVLGGPSTVSESVRTQLVPYASSGQVTRLSGVDRYATAADISAEFYAPGVQAAFIATGLNFADALAGGPAAALRDSPLLLVRTDAIPASIQAELTRLQPQRIYVLGSNAAVNDAVAAQLDAFTTGPVQRLQGPNRYATSAAIVRTFWSRSTGYVATGLHFADALAGGALAGKQGVPILLAATTSVSPYTGQEVLRLGSSRLTMLGSSATLSAGVESTLKKLVATP